MEPVRWGLDQGARERVLQRGENQAGRKPVPGLVRLAGMSSLARYDFLA